MLNFAHFLQSGEFSFPTLQLFCKQFMKHPCKENTTIRLQVTNQCTLNDYEVRLSALLSNNYSQLFSFSITQAAWLHTLA